VVAVFIDYKQFEGKTHRIVGQKGWQEVVDYSLKWEEEHWK
jgi:non-heme chloroperoxidase